jgi:hypothetical protein
MIARGTRAENGYVLIVVLILSGLTLATAATYSHHSIVTFRNSEASLFVHESRESAHSGIAFAGQSLAAAQPLGATSLTAGDKGVTVEIADAGTDKRSIRVQSVMAGMGATVLGEATVYTTPGPALPTVKGTAGTAVLADAGATWATGTKTISDTIINGTLILARGSRITLRDVVVNGTIVSEPALRGAPYPAADATRLIVQGGLRVEPSALLRNCGILMPDGAMAFEPSARAEVHGVVVAKEMTLNGSGFLDSYVLADMPVAVPDTFDRPGWGRAPLSWPTVLETGALGLATMAFPPHQVSSTEAKAIKGFAFPKGY